MDDVFAVSEHHGVGSSAESFVTTPARWSSEHIGALRVRLVRALVATYGVEVGEDAAAEAVAWALAHRDRVAGFANPVGYLFRVGQSWARKQLKERHNPQAAVDRYDDRLPDLDLQRALRSLPEVQRTALVLVHGCGWTYHEVARLLNRSEPSVRNHLHRGMEVLRTRMTSRSESFEVK
jgi:RNA polymerase sigma factor (sigma-70 family)